MISAAGIERYVKEETQKTEKNIGLEGAYKSSNRGGGGINEGHGGEFFRFKVLSVWSLTRKY